MKPQINKPQNTLNTRKKNFRLFGEDKPSVYSVYSVVKKEERYDFKKQIKHHQSG